MEVSRGLRVIRGNDWIYRNQDGGRGHVGTVIRVKDVARPGFAENSVLVQWDSGNKGVYRAGNDKAYDLKVFDSSPAGTSHPRIWCDGCNESEIRGLRWRCAECPAVDLCTDCYMNDKHDVDHVFLRVQSSKRSSMGPPMPRRSCSQRQAIRGIFLGARVVRYPSWFQRSPEDGEPGIVLIEEQSLQDRAAGRVLVKFNEFMTPKPSIEDNGKVEVSCTLPGYWGEIYYSHLPCLGDAEEIRIGDRVVVTASHDELEKLQRRHGSWEPSILNELQKEGTVMGRAEQGDFVVKFADCESPRMLHPGAVTKLHTFCPGQTVRISSDLEMVKRCQTSHGGWVHGMKQLLGKTGRVIKVVHRDLQVRFPNKEKCVFNAIVLLREKTTYDGTCMNDRTVDCCWTDLETQTLLAVAYEGNVRRLRRILDEKPHLAHCQYRPGKTLIGNISENCDLEIVKLLVERGAFAESVDANGRTPLMHAALGSKPENVKYLLEQGVNVDAMDFDENTALQTASSEGCEGSIRRLLEYGADINLQNEYASPLHNACSNGCHPAVLDIFLDRRDTDLKVVTDTLLTVIHFAAGADETYPIKRLLEKVPRLLESRNDKGFTPLIMAAYWNAGIVADYLIKEAHCDINAIEYETGVPALYIAVTQGNLEVMDILIRNGADCNIVGRVLRNTCLQIALNVREEEAYKDKWVEQPFLVEMKVRWGRLGIRTMHDALVAYLVSNGADLDEKMPGHISIRQHLFLIGDPIAPALVAIHEQRRRLMLNTPVSTKATRDSMRMRVKPNSRGVTECQEPGECCTETEVPPGDSDEATRTSDEEDGEIKRLNEELDEQERELVRIRRKLQCFEIHAKKKIIFACGHHVCYSFADLISECPVCCEPLTGVTDVEDGIVPEKKQDSC